MMLDYLAEKTGTDHLLDAARLIYKAIEDSFAAAAVRPMEFGGDMGTIAVTCAVLDPINDRG